MLLKGWSKLSDAIPARQFWSKPDHRRALEWIRLWKQLTSTSNWVPQRAITALLSPGTPFLDSFRLADTRRELSHPP
jgi:hypothetical protein